MPRKTNPINVEYETKAKNLLKAELKRRGMTYAELAEKLAEMGVHETERNLNNKISRGGFTAAFLLQCLDAIGARYAAAELVALWAFHAAAEPASGNKEGPVAGQPQSKKAEPAKPQPPSAQNKKPKSWSAKEPCENYAGREQSDLCQQWRMAKATEEIERLTDRQNFSPP